MTKLQNPSAYLLIILLAGMSWSQVSCRKPDATVLLALDSLDRKIAASAKELSIDFPTIVNRQALIESHLRLIYRYYTAEMSPELGIMLAKYKGIGKLYQRFVEEYGDVFNEHKALAKQAENLRSDVRKGKINRADFGTYYRQELADATKNHEQALEICGHIPEVEPDYQRISSRVQSELEQLAQDNAELKAALNELGSR